MPAYAIVEIQVTDRERFDEYRKAVPAPRERIRVGEEGATAREHDRHADVNEA